MLSGEQGDVVAQILTLTHSYMQQAQMYAELFEAFDPHTSDAIEYLNHYHRVDKIWKELQDGREPGEGNDEILEAWERVHRKACEVYSQLKHENQRLKL
jgi:hypothetical protein